MHIFSQGDHKDSVDNFFEWCENVLELKREHALKLRPGDEVLPAAVANINALYVSWQKAPDSVV